MNIGKFLTFNFLLKTFILAIILFTITTFVFSREGPCIFGAPPGVGCDRLIGLPLPFLLISDYPTKPDYGIVLLDFTFWYLISAGLLLTISKVRFKK